jgi:hypothetical protein
MSRRLSITLIVVGVLSFLAISTLLARAFSAEGAERSAITSLITAQAAGNTAGVIARIHDCAANAGCRAQVATASTPLRRQGTVEILQLDPSSGFSLSGTNGIARVAWNTTDDRRPVVQCVHVRRAGNVLKGLKIELLRLSAEIRSNSECPGRVSGP